MTQEHPITPPPDLVQQWVSLACEYEGNETWIDLATQAANWGADQELEACVEHLKRIWSPSDTIDSLYTARRPKPPSLKEQALAALAAADGADHPVVATVLTADQHAIIRRALEALPDE